MGRNKNKKKMWNRKRKHEDKTTKSNSDRKPYVKVTCSNPKMEAYYAIQGLHSFRREGDVFVPNTTAEEMEKERHQFISTLRSTLPASFRIGQNIEEEFKEKLRRDVEDFVGTEIEILIDEDGNAVSKPREKEKEKEKDASADGKDDKEKDDSAEAKESASENDTTNETEAQPSPEAKTTMKKLAPAKPIPYIPDAFQLSVDRRTIRRNPALQKFHDWLKVQNEAGFITRQETVSMIPPVVLSPESDHAVLDMCAAPGSKTSQLLEIVSAIPPGEIEPKGFVVANDSDAKRAYMLVHQLRRLNSPASFVTAKDAQFWPLMSRGVNITDEERAQEGLFDRVLCDVPCSGDGTARKNPGIWKHWTQSAALSVHPLQASIALNGARLAKVGGYICYSTCSMNPIENEAVVAEILRSADGSLELVEKRPDLDGMVARKGWTTWKVFGEKESRKEMKNRRKKNNAKMQQRRKEWEEKEKQKQEEGSAMDVDGDENAKDEEKNDDSTETKKETDADVEMKPPVDTSDSWNKVPPSWDAQAWEPENLQKRVEDLGLVEFKKFEDVPQDTKHHIKPSCFPPTPEEIEKFQLEKCLRCLPQDLDTGGFFVALFKKVAPLSARARRKAEELAIAVARKTDPTFNANDIEGTNMEAETETETSGDKKMKLNSGDSAPPAEVKKDDEDASTTTEANAETAADGKKEGEQPKKKNKSSYGFDKSDSFVAVDQSLLPPLVDFYGLTDQFAKGQFMARAGGNSKLLYFITETVKKNLIDRGIQDRVQVINSGLRAFERRNKDDCLVNYRPSQESIQFVAPHMTKRKFVISYKDFTNCLDPGHINCGTFSEPLATQIRALSLGAFVVALKGYELNIAKKMYLVMWRCRGDNVNCLVNAAEMAGFHSKMKAIPQEGGEAGDEGEKAEDA